MIIEHQTVAMRGRNPKDPSDRTKGVPTEQRLEINSQGIANCITTVQKDNLILEKIVKLGNAANSNQRCAVYDTKGIAPTITTCGGGNLQPMWVEVKQATKQGFIPCKIGGGGGFELSKQPNEKGKSNCRRRDMSNTDNGEYP